VGDSKSILMGTKMYTCHGTVVFDARVLVAGSEVDIRGTYTVLAVADLCNILTPELVEGSLEFLLRFVWATLLQGCTFLVFN